MNYKYLYGASVQGIQAFIFKTNKLKEIAGASELVEQITSTRLFPYLGDNLATRDGLMQHAAGTIKCAFTVEQEEELKQLVLKFPKAVAEAAPGLTLSQAVVEIKGETGAALSKAVDELERKLQEQRNRVGHPHEVGYMTMQRNRRTGNAAVKYDGDRPELRIKKEDGQYPDVQDNQILLNLDDISTHDQHSWIAVMHADGNGLGQLIQNMGEQQQGRSLPEAIKAFRDFSTALDKATKAAAKSAFKAVVKNVITATGHYPIRPVILGGDDITIIIRADLAMDFTKVFMEEFERRTNGILDSDGLTSCAGIAYVKQSYPFHYAVNLAESLCKEAKKWVKHDVDRREDQHQMPRSAISFYKVQDSYIESLEDMRQRSQSIREGGDLQSLNAGPYLLSDYNEHRSIPKLLELKVRLDTMASSSSKQGDGDNKGVSKIRSLITAYHEDPAGATVMINRMEQLGDKTYDYIIKPSTAGSTSMIQDLLHLHSFNIEKEAK